jgi:raffinose/stachyose/melibiose transport system permease protein
MQESMPLRTKTVVSREENGRSPSLLAEIWKKRVWYLFLMPTFAFLIVFMYYPIAAGFFYSFFDWRGIGQMKFVGLENFRALFRDEVFLLSLGNMVKLTLIHVAINITAPLFAAKAIIDFGKERYRFLYRVIFTIPMVVPFIVNILIWKFIYTAELGVLNQFLVLIGLESWTRAWLSDPQTALYAIALMNFPWISGLYFLLYYAGLINIPHELIEAARMDGARGLRIFTSIEVPLILGQIKLIVILTFISWIQNYAAVLIMTRGGPFQTTMVPGLWMYLNAFNFSEFGYGSAIGVVLFIIILVITLINNRLIKSDLTQ